MNKLVKKTSVILLVLIFFISGFTTISANSTQKNDADVSLSSTETIKTTVCRYGPYGTTQEEVSVRVRKGANLDEIEAALVDRCAELTENDEEIQQYLDDSGVNLSLISFIRSRGRGTHYDFKIRIPVRRCFKKFPNLPPYYRILKIPVVYARYPRDQKATSTVRPYGGGNVTTYVGSHEVLAIGFLGYTTWIGRIAERGFILRCGFAGYAMVNVYRD